MKCHRRRNSKTIGVAIGRNANRRARFTHLVPQIVKQMIGPARVHVLQRARRGYRGTVCTVTPASRRKRIRIAARRTPHRIDAILMPAFLITSTSTISRNRERYMRRGSIDWNCDCEWDWDCDSVFAAGAACGFASNAVIADSMPGYFRQGWRAVRRRKFNAVILPEDCARR